MAETKPVGHLWRRYRGVMLLFVAVGVAVTTGLAVVSEVGQLLAARAIDYAYVPLILLLAPLNYCLRYVKWRYFLGLLGVEVPEGENLLIFVAGLSMTLTPGKAGELLKAYLLHGSRGVPVTVTAPVIMAERLTDGISMILLAAMGAVYFQYGIGVLVITAALVAAFVAIMHQQRLVEWVLDRCGRFRWGKGLVAPLERLHGCFQQLLQPVPLLVAVTLGVVSWGFEGIVLYLAVIALGGHISVLGATFVVSFSAIVGALTLLPGGLVAAEGSIMGLLLLFGLGQDVAGAATIITRFSTLWLGVALGVVGLLLAQRLLDQKEVCLECPNK